MVFFGEAVTNKQDQTLHLFSPLALDFWGPSGAKRVEYHPVGCVIYVTATYFKLRWISGAGNDEVVEYDGMIDQGRVARVKWLKGGGTTLKSIESLLILQDAWLNLAKRNLL